MRRQICVITASVFLLTGCEIVKSTIQSPQDAPKKVSSDGIGKIEFNLPKEIKWNKTNTQGITSFIPNGVEIEKSPFIISTQFLPNVNSKDFQKSLLTKMKNECVQSAANRFKTISSYPNQEGIEILCNKLKKSPSKGLVYYVDMFADNRGINVLSGKVVTPASEKIGKLDRPKNEKQAKATKAAILFTKLVRKIIENAKYCDTSGKCL